MESIEIASKTDKKSRSLEDEIIAQRDKLKKLEDRYREQQRKEREKNHKLVIDLIKSEKLDLITIEKWRSAMPIIKNSLKSD